MSLLGILVFVTIILMLCLRNSKLFSSNDDEDRNFRSFVKSAYKLILLFIAAAFAWRVIAVVSTDRAPRHDIDGSAVYQQMDELKNGTEQSR